MRGGVGERVELEGIVISGRGRASYFTQLEWAREQFRERLGFEPYPGTLNVRLGGEEYEGLWRVYDEGLKISPPPGSGFCEAACLYATVEGKVDGAVVLPRSGGHYGVVEVVSPLKIREVLGLRDGDRVRVEVLLPTEGIRAVLLDMDNTLLETLQLFYVSLNEALARLGLRGVAREELADWLNHGLTLREALERAGVEGAAIERAVAEVRAAYAKHQGEYLRPASGAVEALAKLKGAGVAVALVTNNMAPREVIEEHLRRFGMGEFVDVMVTGREVSRRKPHPEAIFKCMRELKAYPRQCLVVGDAAADIRAGRAAGALTAAVLTGAGSREGLASEGPDFIASGLLELVDLLLSKGLIGRASSPGRGSPCTAPR